MAPAVLIIMVEQGQRFTLFTKAQVLCISELKPAALR